jgi:hypothetical protein
LLFYVKYAYIKNMSVSIAAVEKAMNAAQALRDSPLSVVYADVPAYEIGDLLNPLIGEVKHIGSPFSFHRFGLAAITLDQDEFAIRLTPPECKEVGVPIVKQPEEAYAGLSRSGFTALRAVVKSAKGNRNPFALFGESPEGELVQELTMPTLESETKLIEIVSGQIIKKAFTALTNARHQQSPAS